MKTLLMITGLLGACCAMANPIATSVTVMRNSLDSATTWTAGEEVCDCAFPGGSLYHGDWIPGHSGNALRSFAEDGPAISIASSEFRWDYSMEYNGEHFPGWGGLIDFWISMGDGSGRDTHLDIELFRLSGEDFEYSLCICDSTTDGESGFILRGGNGARSVSSTQPGTSLVDLFPDDSGTGWHHIAMDWGSNFGLELMVDGVPASLIDVTEGEGYPGYPAGVLNLLDLRVGPAWVGIDNLRLWDDSAAYNGPNPVLMADSTMCEYTLGIDVHSPLAFTLPQNTPNPFNPGTTISFTLPHDQEVELSVYNLQGELVRNVIQSRMAAGEHSLPFDGSALASGVYFYRLVTQEGVQTRSMTLVK